MKLPIDTSTLSFTASLPPKPVLDFDTKQPKMDNGEPLFTLEVVAFGDQGAEILAVKVAGTPAIGIKQGVPLKISGLVASTWSMEGGRNGVSFRASKVELLNGPGSVKAGS